MARSFGVQRQQLLPKGEVLQEKFFSGAKEGDNPSKEMSKTHKHLGIITKSAPRHCAFQVIDSADAQSFGEAQGSDCKQPRHRPQVMRPDLPAMTESILHLDPEMVTAELDTLARAILVLRGVLSASVRDCSIQLNVSSESMLAVQRLCARRATRFAAPRVTVPLSQSLPLGQRDTSNAC